MIKAKNIAVVRTDRIGDVVLSIPMIDVIKTNFPDSKVTFIVRNYTRPLLENNKSLSGLISLYEKNGKILFFKNLFILRKNSFDSAILVSPTFKIALLLFFAGIKYRIGTGYRWYSFFFNRKIYEHRKFGDKHELQFNINMLKVFGINEVISEDSVHFNIHIDESAKIKVDNFLSQKGCNRSKPIIIVHPGSKGSSVDLPINKMKELIRVMAQTLECYIILTGSENEKHICEEMKINDKILNSAGLFELKDLVALIDKCSVFIANSTGPIHIAAALNKHVIGFYPKIQACSPKRWGPFTEKKDIFMPEMECDNCSSEQCARLNCMDSINMEKVLNSIKSALTKQNGVL